MYTVALFLGLAALSKANPAPQAIDYAAVAAAGPIHSPSIAFGVASQVVTYNAKLAAESAAAQITAQPLSGNLEKRDGNCAPQPTGAGPIPSPDTASDFLAYQAFASVASAAAVPSGYNSAFVNLQASNNANGYMGFVTLSTYDTNLCAAKCSANSGCSAINIYFERDPTIDPGAACPDPSSTTAIKCVFWGGPVTLANAVNTGQTRSSFQVVIAGSNGYTLSTVPTLPGYTGPVSLGIGAINAPLDCNGYNTYMGYKLFNDGAPFDPGRCAAACTAQTAYNIAHPPSDGSAPMLCNFVNTYILNDNGVSQGQYCSLYNETWDASYATNFGQTRGSDIYTIDDSYSYSNATSPGKCVKASPTTPSLPNVSTYVKQGCFGGGVLNGRVSGNSNINSLEYCAAYCQNFLYFAVENGNSCSCGNTPSNTNPATTCNTRCSGNSTETCGGFGSQNTYMRPAAPIVPKPTVPVVNGFSLLSCTSGVSLNGPHKSGSSNSVETCAAYCAAFSYFEVQNGNYCGCGNTLAGHQVVKGCNTVCTGNSTEYCGGFGQSNVYYKV